MDCFKDSEKVLEEFEYINECIYSGDLPDENLDELEGCKCIGKCSFEQGCTCLKFCVPYTNDGILRDNIENGILECTDNCSCIDCWNIVVQKPSKANIKVVHSGFDDKRYKVVANDMIIKGTFVSEYVGEILTAGEACQRLSAKNKKNKNNYLLCIGEHFNESIMITSIDAEYYGNVSRFINHGCDPNLEIKLVRTGMMIPRFCLFAKRDIQESEEVSYNYGIEYMSETKEAGPVCRCNSTKCCGYLPVSYISLPKTG